FTMEEAWEALPGVKKQESVHLESWPHAGSHDPARADWIAFLRRVRGEIQKKVDPLRKQGVVGGGQDVAVRFTCTDVAVAERLGAETARLLGEHDPEGVLEILGVAE